jgi:hypothetical protein
MVHFRIDRFRRGVFWKGHDWRIRGGGHCLVNWKTCLLPKKWGGIGFKDLDKFGRALSLRCLWHNWGQQIKPWKHLVKIKDPVDRQLFFSSTIVHVSDGRDTPF